nr:metallopeptidase family protein [Gordonia araii]
MVNDALDEIPEELAREMSNVVILVEPMHPEGPHLLGLYEGVALTERTTEYAGFLPDTITIYRDSILAICSSPDEVREQVRITVIHEIAHHFGIDDQWLHDHGWA